MTESNNDSSQESPPCPGIEQPLDQASSQPIVNVPHDDQVINIISRTLAPNERIIVCGSCWQYINIRPSTKMCSNNHLSQDPPSYSDLQQTSDPIMIQPQVKLPHGLTGISNINIVSNTLGPGAQIIVCFSCSEHKITRFERKNFTIASCFIGSEMGTETKNYSSQQLPSYPGLQQPSDQLTSQQQVMTESPVITINSNKLGPTSQIIVKKKGSFRPSFLFRSKIETKSSATSLPQMKSPHGLTGVPVINIISNTLGPNSTIKVGCLCHENIITRVESKSSMRIASCLLGSKLNNECYNGPYQKLTEKPIVNIRSNTMGPNAQIIVCDYNGIHIIKLEGKPSKSTYFFAVFSGLIACWPCACYRNNSGEYCSY
ncbi:uncharacterized protein LOC126973801 isoform X1 [Leptidea sinapis]|uniref:uncharacterized protein LOC126973801 isoform X1 n=2 Tax=Leptidea sinapis TaxID=189913 RepID=UPI0021289BE7|nr:uncharacterized protein LOC126973801 isoform X1 [Leptidea sinapis]XP_050677089.1 uncharacterized protein LOC126973801 isoform X1 [Leptidea sinapis]XP_050677090.1 uncharacterized protein LOC126973801 isoform X1 [Leptidea sinapis]XP_050677091.1 uncharacterized protein LOC126973801 isoform X1 [Leptidea sinapis]